MINVYIFPTSLKLATITPVNKKVQRIKRKITGWEVSWSYDLVVKGLDSQSRGPVLKTTGWLQGRLSRHHP